MTAGETWDDPYVVTGANSGSVTFTPTTAYWYVLVDSTVDLRKYDFITSTTNDNWIAFHAASFVLGTYSGYIQYGYYGVRPFYADGGAIIFEWRGTAGVDPITFTWTSTDPPPPRPYTWATADPITGDNGSVTYDDVAPDIGERYYSWTPSAGALLTVTSNEPYGYYELYSGTPADPAVYWHDTDYVGYGYMDESPPGPYDEPLQFTADGGPYHIIIYPNGDPTAATAYTLSWSAGAPPPYVVTNDDFTSPLPMNLAAGSMSYDNTGATTVNGYYATPRHVDDSRSIWYSFTTGGTNQALILTATPTTADLGRRATIYIERYYSDSAAWEDDATQSTNGAAAVLYASTEYRVALTFPEGDQGMWENAGSLTWTTPDLPPNLTPETATDASQSEEVTFLGLGSEVRWYRVTQPIDGGLSIVLGDASLPRFSPLYPAVISVYKPASMIGPNQYNWVREGYYYARDSEAPAYWGGGPTSGYLNGTGKAGDVYYVEVAYNHTGLPATFLLRWGVSTELTWGDWQDSSYSRAPGPPISVPGLGYWDDLFPVSYYGYHLRGYNFDAYSNYGFIGQGAGITLAEYYLVMGISPVTYQPISGSLHYPIEEIFSEASANSESHNVPEPPPWWDSTTFDALRSASESGTNGGVGRRWVNDTGYSDYDLMRSYADSQVGLIGGGSGFTGRMIHDPNGSMSINTVNASGYVASSMCFGNPLDGGRLDINASMVDRWSVLPVIHQGWLNGLFVPGPWQSSYQSVYTVWRPKLKTMAVEWAPGYPERGYRIDLYGQFAMGWTRDSSFYADGTPSMLQDTMSGRLYDLDDADISAFASWQGPGVSMGTLLHEVNAPLTARSGTEYISPLPEGTTFDGNRYEVMKTDIESQLRARHHWNYLSVNSLFQSGGSIAHNNVDLTDLTAGGGGFFGLAWVDWSLTTNLSGTIWPALDYPDYRLGTWVENLDPLVLGIPPLRQRARDDGLTTGARHESTRSSAQASARRGGRTYT